MKYPAEVYKPSPRLYKGIQDISYPFHDRMVTVTTCGRICIGRKKINFSRAFIGQNVGIREVDEDSCRVEPLDNPFGPKVLTMSSV